MMIYCKRIGEHSSQIPSRKSNGAGGYDLRWVPDSTDGRTEPCRIFPGEIAVLKTGWSIAIPHGHVGLIRDRSSVAMRGLAVVAGVIDADYRGEVGVVLTNHTDSPVEVERFERIAQLLVVPCSADVMIECADLGETVRGSGGFGSTGSW